MNRLKKRRRQANPLFDFTLCRVDGPERLSTKPGPVLRKPIRRSSIELFTTRSLQWTIRQMSQLPRAEDHRKPDYPIQTIFYRRWSPRALSGEPITDDELLTIFEAVRWAPSTYNEQEWRFLYARRDTEHWQTFFGLLVEGNQAWCKDAAALVVVLSHKVFSRNGKPNPVHTFDAGAAFENLALQG